MSIKNKELKNASWLITGKIIQSILGLVVSLLSARYLGPSNFGIINYAASVTQFFVPIAQLGYGNVLVQRMVSNRNLEETYLGSAIVTSLITSVACIVGVGTFALFANAGESVTILVCILYSLIMLFQSLNLIEYWFQSMLLSKYTAIASLIGYFLVSAYKIFLLASGKNILWFAVSNATDYMIVSLILCSVYFRKGKHLKVSLVTTKDLFASSKYYIIANLMISFFAQTDKVMLKQMIDAEATGYYSTAVSCVGLTSFIFMAIIDSLRPSIFESIKITLEMAENKVAVLSTIIIALAVLQSLLFTILAKVIITILYGKAYLPAADVMRIVVWYTAFSYLGSVRNIWLLMENKQKYLVVINAAGAVFNIIGNYFLIPVLGIKGAAITTLLTQIFTNIIVGFILRPVRGYNKVLIKAINPRFVMKCGKELVDKIHS